MTANKILATLPVLLAQIKARNNSYKLKNKIWQILYLLYHHWKITKTFCFNLDWSKDINENLKHDIEFIIKSNESLAENKIKNQIKQLLLKYKHGNNIHEHGKQQNEWVTWICS